LWAALEQFGIETVLERADPPRQGHVIDPQPCRRAGQPAATGDRQKGAQAVPIEIGQNM
jgi:hypothetical protein